MKKLTKNRDEWLVRKVWRQHRKNIRLAQACQKPQNHDKTTLEAPEYFCIATAKGSQSNAVKYFFRFLAQIREFNGRNLCVDMRQVGRMVVNATLLFKAELSYLICRGVKISGIPPNKLRTHQVLVQTGIAKMLSISCGITIDREDTIHWRHVAGSYKRVQPEHLKALLDEATNHLTSKLYTGMIESVNNCIEHAYDDHPKRRSFSQDQEGWWGFQEIRDGILTTCICDLGIGIANSLPIKLSKEPDLYTALMSIYRNLKGDDVKSILAAIEYGRSSTGKKERGKGLRDAHKVIDAAGEGSFQLASNRGWYSYEKTPSQIKATTHSRRLQGTIAGTIYLWTYPIKVDSVEMSSSLHQGEFS